MKTDSLFTKNSVERPVKNFCKAMREHPDMFHSYKANIAMAFKDEISRHRSEQGYKYLNRGEIHTLANNAAQNFLQLLIKE